MAFESDQGLASDGSAGPQVWADLLRAAVQHQVDRQPYDYLEVSEAGTEALSVWRDGRVVYTTPCNTGIAAAPTTPGIYPVYARYLSTTMSRTNPDAPLTMTRHPLRGLLQRRRCGAWVSARPVWVSAEPGLRRAALQRRGGGLQLRFDRHARRGFLRRTRCPFRRAGHGGSWASRPPWADVDVSAGSARLPVCGGSGEAACPAVMCEEAPD